MNKSTNDKAKVICPINFFQVGGIKTTMIQLIIEGLRLFPTKKYQYFSSKSVDIFFYFFMKINIVGTH